jgi:transcriptional regulator with XRE-family HTH domain|nr:MAG: helix-turn-helix domain protein [Bacteriophage sp.]DAN03020.1 MAG TPA: Helix-turn-helix XRE-family like protein [Caudoviricetes sp.]
MPKRDTVQPNVDSIAEKVSAKSWSEASFSKMIGKHKRWLSEVRRGKNLPSPEEAAKMCTLLGVEPEEILTEPVDIERVIGLLENGAKETPDPKIEGVSAEAQEILDYIRDATPAELAEVCRYIGYLKSKRGTE